MSGVASEIYYDPYDFEIDADPYPIWKRMRDEMPLYRNDRFDFYAVSRFADVESCSVDWQTFISGRGSVLEMIRSGIEIPRGMILFEDPPIHDLHRKLLQPRVHTATCSGAGESRHASSAPTRSTRSSGATASTSCVTSGPTCPCGSSANCSASPKRTR